MKKVLTSSRVTDGQKKRFRQLGLDNMEHAVKVVTGKLETDAAGMERLFENNPELREGLTDWLWERVRQLCVTDEYAEEVESKCGYLSGYTKPVSVPDQIDILRSYWPQFNPDPAITYLRKMYDSLEFPNWVEGPFVLVRPGFFGPTYGEEVEAVLAALKKSLGGNFHNYREENLGPKYLREHDRSKAYQKLLIESQPNSDLLIAGGQFGLRFRGCSVRRARAKFIAKEFGAGAKNIGTMLLANPTRLRHYDDLWIDGAGDEYSDEGDEQFEYAPYFKFNDKQLRFGASESGHASGYYGSASLLLP